MFKSLQLQTKFFVISVFAMLCVALLAGQS